MNNHHDRNKTLRTEAPALAAPDRPHQVRQERVAPPRGWCRLELPAGTYPVLDYSAFGVAVFSDGSFRDQRAEQAGALVLGDARQVDLTLRFVREEPRGGGLLVAFEILGPPLDTDCLRAALLALKAIAPIRLDAAAAAELPAGFRLPVLEARQFLAQLAGTVEALDTIVPRTTGGETASLTSGVLQAVHGCLEQTLPPLFERLAEELRAMPPAVRRQAEDYFSHHLATFLRLAPLGERACRRSEGRGSDFDLLNLICRNESAGATLFAKCMHHHLLQQPCARALRRRIDFLCASILALLSPDRPGRRRILSLASGPAAEVQQALRALDQRQLDRASFTLADPDLEALQFAQRRLKELCRELGRTATFHYRHLALADLLRRGLPERFDLICAPGLAAGASDAEALETAACLRSLLNPGGTLVLGCPDSADPSRPGLELGYGWPPATRDAAALRLLYGGLPEELRIEADPGGGNLYCIFRKG